MAWTDDGRFIPTRRDPQRRRCDRCHLVFAAGGVPRPIRGGPHDGALICTRCLAEMETDARIAEHLKSQPIPGL